MPRSGGASAAAALLLPFCVPAAMADTIVVPATIAPAGGAEFAYRLDAPATGAGHLDIEWTDATGRVAERKRLALTLDHASEVRFSLDLARAVSARNEVKAQLVLDNGAAHDAAADFIVPPRGDAWSDYQIIMWQIQPPHAYPTLKRLGVTAGAVEHNRATDGVRNRDVETLASQDMRWYVENIATDFYAPYHRFTEGRPVNWRMQEARERYWHDPSDPNAFMREPSLSDPVWLDRVRQRLTRLVATTWPYRPLFYDLADEGGIANTASFWDFDRSPPSLDGMRAWLEQRYGSLAALNAQWGSRFADWNAVMPMTTRAAMTRSDDNFSAWADFKAWMDVAYAHAIASGSTAVHDGAPGALAALEGGQIPGWGGYDYSLLAESVDVMELYDHGDNVALVHSLNPKVILLTTAFGDGPVEARRVWRELLRGNRGLVLWDEHDGFAGADGSLGARGKEASPYFSAIRNGIGALIIASERETAPVATLYSPASQRTQWILDERARGEDWSHRSTSSEYADNPIRVATRFYVDLVKHMGLAQSYLSSRDVARGALAADAVRILLLPQALALSAKEADAIRQFVARGGTAIADGEPGRFDEHSRLLPQPLLADVFAGAPERATRRFAFGKGEAVYLAAAGAHSAARGDLARLLAAQGIAAPYELVRPTGEAVRDVETYVYRCGDTAIVALLRDLAPPPPGVTIARGPQDPGEAVRLVLPRPAYVYDVVRRRPLGRTDRLALALAPFEPTLLALSERQLPPPEVAGPARIEAGETAALRLTASAAHDVLHVDVADPRGTTIPAYSGNLVVADGSAVDRIPFAVNDRAGAWRVTVTDILSGAGASATLTLGGETAAQ